MFSRPTCMLFPAISSRATASARRAASLFVQVPAAVGIGVTDEIELAPAVFGNTERGGEAAHVLSRAGVEVGAGATESWNSMVARRISTMAREKPGRGRAWAIPLARAHAEGGLGEHALGPADLRVPRLEVDREIDEFVVADDRLCGIGEGEAQNVRPPPCSWARPRYKGTDAARADIPRFSPRSGSPSWSRRRRRRCRGRGLPLPT